MKRISRMRLPDADELRDEWTRWFQLHGFGSHSEDMANQVIDFIYLQVPLTQPRELSEEEKSDARDIFEGKSDAARACRHCAGLHPAVVDLKDGQQPCPRVKRVKWHTDGMTILDVEYWPNGEWETDVVFPGDVYDD
jgi:hypothetical protein